MTKKFTMKRLTYGIIKEFEDGTTLWYEPITDVIDAFVLRKQNGSIIRIYKENEVQYGKAVK